jgi:hypothetical protein
MRTTSSLYNAGKLKIPDKAYSNVLKKFTSKNKEVANLIAHSFLDNAAWEMYLKIWKEKQRIFEVELGSGNMCIRLCRQPLLKEQSMSRSRKKTPKTGITTAESEKDNKRKANRIFRRATRVQLKKGDSQFVSIKEVSNVWSFDKDGKQFLKNATQRDLRK